MQGESRKPGECIGDASVAIWNHDVDVHGDLPCSAAYAGERYGRKESTHCRGTLRGRSPNRAYGRKAPRECRWIVDDVAIYGIGGWLVADTNGWTKNLNWSLLPWFVVFQILGVLFFSSIFLTVGASISELKEAQSILMPVWMLLVAPIMVWFVALRDPNGPVAVTLSFFPPSSPLMMILRLASGQTIPSWQPPLAAVLLVCATLVVVILAGRIYRASLLRTDSARTFAQILGRLR